MMLNALISTYSLSARRVALFTVLLLAMWSGSYPTYAGSNTVDLSLRDVELSAAMEMLSKREKVNVVLAEGVKGKVSINLYGVGVEDAIHIIANAAGFSVEKRGGSFHVIKHEDVNNYASSDQLQIKTFKLRYSNAATVSELLGNYLSSYGTMTLLEERNMVVVEDTPEFLHRLSLLVKELDYRPKQILIEAKILEIRLDDAETFGVEWRKLLNGDADTRNTLGSLGTQGLANTTAPGLFVDIGDLNFQALLEALETSGKARTLSSPTLLTVENEPASVIVGNRLGYLNTVTINQVTTETTEFLESGVILEVTPSVDGDGNIKLDIHPEVSTGTVTDGVPSQDTTSVDTQLIVPDGATSFIGGLMRLQAFDDHRGVPVLGRLPIAGKLFSRQEERAIRTEIIVLITPKVVDPSSKKWFEDKQQKVNKHSDTIEGALTTLTD